MLGWFRLEMLRASRSKRCSASGLEDRCEGRILTATVRSRRVSRARYTSPIPPALRGEAIPYGPSLVPGTSGIGARHYSPTNPLCIESDRGDGWSATLTLVAAV